MKNLVLVACWLPLLVFGQKSYKHNGWSRSELGVMGGGTYYIGDLNQKQFKHTNLAGQLFYRYNFNYRLAYRANFTYGFIEAYDSEAKEAIFVNRNLSFQTKLYEFSNGVELTYFPFEIGNKRYRGTGYLMAELGLTKINPSTEYNGDMVELQPLGTEGQGTALSTRPKYSRLQLVVPIAVGARITISDNIGMNLEYGVRYLFTDYLDDVGSYRYVDPVALQGSNGPIAADLSNRTLDGNRFGRRGDQSTRDWYFFGGLGLTVRLGGKTGCPSPAM